MFDDFVSGSTWGFVVVHSHDVFLLPVRATLTVDG